MRPNLNPDIEPSPEGLVLPPDDGRDPHPLVLLDVDGVINDLGAFYEKRRWGIDVIESHGYQVRIPDFMPELIRRLAVGAEIYWCTTWRDRANDEIATHLGVGPFPVVDDGTNQRCVDWKPAAAYDLAREALEQGRGVIWIEDFYGEPPVDKMPDGVLFVDTGRAFDDAVLLPEQFLRFPITLSDLVVASRAGVHWTRWREVTGEQWDRAMGGFKW